MCIATVSIGMVSAPTPTTKGKRRPRVKGLVGNKEMDFLVDSGASVSVCSEKMLQACWQNWKFRRIPLPPTLRLSGVTGHKINIVDYVEMEIGVLGKTVNRPMLIVSGLDVNHCILGYDFIKEEGLVIDGSKDEVYFRDNQIKKWDKAALQVRGRTTIMPGQIQHVNLIANNGQQCIAENETAYCTPVTTAAVSFPELITRIGKGGEAYLPILNSTDRKVILKAKDTIGFAYRTEDYFDSIEELNDKTMASIFGTIGNEPIEPKTGLIKPMTKEEEDELRARLQIQVEGNWRQKYEDLMLRYHDVCSKDKFDLGHASVIKHKIKMTDDTPVHARQFRIPFAHEEVIFDYVEQLLKQGAIEYSRSPYNSPIFCVAKKAPPNADPNAPPPLRVVLDYRQVNAKSLPDRYSIKEVRECIDQVGREGSKIFTTIDLTAGFWQQELEETSKQYTAFSVPGKAARYQFCVTPMGLQGSPASFARLMDHVMRQLTGVLTYIDDVLVHSENHEQQLIRLEQVLLRLRKYGLKLNVNKTLIGGSQVQYLGYTISEKGITLSEDKTKAIKEFPQPQDVRQVREFIGLCNYFRFLIPHFSQLTTPLIKLTTKEEDWKGGEMPESAERSFKELKEKLCNKPVVAYPTREGKFRLYTDAAIGEPNRKGGMGAALLQTNKEGKEQVIAYASRGLKDHEKNYGAYLLELAAACWGIEYFNVYLLGKPFTLCTDHKPLETLTTTHTRTLNRLQQLMLQYQFDLQYTKGEDNPVADFLSRNAKEGEWIEEGQAISAINVTREEMKLAQDQDDKMIAVKKFLRMDDSQRKLQDKQIQNLGENCFETDDGILMKELEVNARRRTALWPPTKIRKNIIEAAHLSKDAGHGGKDRTVELAAITNKTAQTVGQLFFERWICRFTAPLTIVTDQGKEFNNAVLQEICTLWDIDKKRTSPFHPQTNSSAESYNRSLIKYFKAMLLNHSTLDWEPLLPCAAMAYNCHIHRSTAESPFFLTYLHDPRLPYLDLQAPRTWKDDSFVHETYMIAQKAFEEAGKKMQTAAEVQKEYYDKRARTRAFREGDRVLVYFPNPPPGINKKFHSQWKPGRITNLAGALNVVVLLDDSKRPTLVHLNRVREERNSNTETNIIVDEPEPQPLQTTNKISQEKKTNTKAARDVLAEQIQESRQLRQQGHDEEEEEKEQMGEDTVISQRARGQQQEEQQQVEDRQDKQTTAERETEPLGPWTRLAQGAFTSGPATRSRGPVAEQPLVPSRCLGWRPYRQRNKSPDYGQ